MGCATFLKNEFVKLARVTAARPTHSNTDPSLPILTPEQITQLNQTADKANRPKAAPQGAAVGGAVGVGAAPQPTQAPQDSHFRGLDFSDPRVRNQLEQSLSGLPRGGTGITSYNALHGIKTPNLISDIWDHFTKKPVPAGAGRPSMHGPGELLSHNLLASAGLRGGQ